MKILAAQIEIPPTPRGRSRDIHIESCASRISRRLASEHADLVVLPELSSIEYSREAFERLDRLAEPLDGPSFRLFQEVAVRFKTTVVYGIARDCGDTYAITQAVVGPDGLLIGYYDKLHIAQFGDSMEKEYFQPGRRLLVLDLGGLRVAPIICYDIRMPELCRTLVLKHGVDLVLHCGAYSRDASFESWHPFVITRAMENQCFVLSLNRAGGHYGESMFCPPWPGEGRLIQRFHPSDEELRILTVDRSSIEDARRDYPFLHDRLDDYQDLECTLVSSVSIEKGS